ncbi:MAG: glycoside hydrolase family 92 protein [Bacteroidetes bacterium]|jgi:predicted alpha-1,2-mannosidase|nr:glycoside hydrolase family 92 protein [Bacteroidota bacterium]MBT4411479.1 glycoside hydrolase family 92 protein [Bacteroidota bacterium]MBT5426915.1 glycoside hydrolase family 92 protein [Bacteroidota bacterium]MBT7095242.1 glycoside hydrolase family 92 protein [Bacteroidota bacterium]MBT7465945.1 glycoside hydrolase family 92 protein [Bacteroidota bacterium]
MRVRLFSLLIVLLLLGCYREHVHLSDYVNTLIGTKPWQEQIQLAGTELPHGNTYPGVCVPSGMTEWTAQTNTGQIPYFYEEGEKARIQGFRGTHYPSGAVMFDYGAVTLMPLTGDLQIDPEERASRFSHKKEISKPHYYSVFLKDYRIKTEITAGKHCGLFRLTYPQDETPFLLFDFYQDGGFIHIDQERNEVYGYSKARGRGTSPEFAGYFVARFDHPIDSFGVFMNDSVGQPVQITEGQNKVSGQYKTGAYVTFQLLESDVVNVKVGTSFISLEQARVNLDQEVPDWDFHRLMKSTQAIWDKELSRIQIEGSEEQKTAFYSALYRCLLLPRSLEENGRYYSPFDGQVHDGSLYTDYSLWDTFRSLHPLLVLINPELVSKLVSSLLNAYDEGGWMPKLPNPGYSNVMMGTHADPVVADAYVKGIRDFDADQAYAAMKKNATKVSTDLYQARVGIHNFMNLGYVSRDNFMEPVARTLEFAYDDFCVAQMAKALGRDDDYEYFIRRASYYKHVIDPDTRMVRSKNSDGSWGAEDDNSISTWAGNTEESLNIYKLNHNFLVPHDVSGLMDIYGGQEAFGKALDVLFDKGYYYVGDEFSMHAPYLYNFSGEPWKTQKLVSQLIRDYFKHTPDGLCGNDDLGQLSSWYIFGAMGFYPVTPGRDEYIIGSPAFEKVVIQLSDSKEFTISAINLSSNNYYIQSVSLNGQELTRSYLRHGEIVAGGELVFEMGPNPNREWGSSNENVPVSSIGDSKFTPIPYLQQGNQVFADSTQVRLGTYVDSGEIYYTLDGSEPTKETKQYLGPITICESTTLNARIYRDGFPPSLVTTLKFTKRVKGRTITIGTAYHDNYKAGGDQALIDGYRGSYNFRNSSWQGYEAHDLDATVDLGSVQRVKSITLGCFQDIDSWIFYPVVIQYEVSVNGKKWETIQTIKNDYSRMVGGIQIKDFSIELNASIRFIRIKAKNIGLTPEWHLSSGGKAWIFADEIIVE